MHIIMHNLLNTKLRSSEILEITFFLLISSDLCHKKMLLESLNIPLKQNVRGTQTGIGILVGQAILSYGSNNQNIVLINNSRTAWPGTDPGGGPAGPGPPPLLRPKKKKRGERERKEKKKKRGKRKRDIKKLRCYNLFFCA